MAKKYFTVGGDRYEADFFCTIEENKTYVDVYKNGRFHSTHHLLVDYRHERTWDDHMGNTECGYFVNIPSGNGKRKRVYMF